MLRFILSIKNYLHKKFQKKSTCRILKIWCSKFYRKSCTLLIARKYSYPCELRLILSLLAELNDVRENSEFFKCTILSNSVPPTKTDKSDCSMRWNMGGQFEIYKTRHFLSREIHVFLNKDDIQNILSFLCYEVPVDKYKNS